MNNLCTVKTVVVDAVGSFDHGSNLDIDLAAEVLTATSFTCKRGVLLRAPYTNTGIVYVGNNDLTAGILVGTDGTPMYAGDAARFPVDNPNKLWVRATELNQKMFWWGC